MNQSSVYFCPRTNLLALGAKDSLVHSGDGTLVLIEEFTVRHQFDFIVSAFSYDLKNQIEHLESNNFDSLSFPDVIMWVPNVILQFEGEGYRIVQGELTEDHKVFLSTFLTKDQKQQDLPTISFQPRISKASYLDKVNLVKKEIQLGNCYELNFCQEFYAEAPQHFNSIHLFNSLFQQTKAPFSAYFLFDEWEVFCASPERYLKRTGNRLYSDPIKGTIRRGENEMIDQELISQLRSDDKERSENVMIVDLVRNDLSKIATKGSVQVDELCGIHTFETVHHMISTISCDVPPTLTLVDCLTATFPMGSMTGAPKVSVMKLIERFESFKRGLYSGSIGLIQPGGDFDFNVVIRSLIYNRSRSVFSCSVGSAITIKSDPEKEYEECLVKIKKIVGVFEGN